MWRCGRFELKASEINPLMPFLWRVKGFPLSWARWTWAMHRAPCGRVGQ